LSGVARNIPNPQLLIHPFVRREAVLSSRIEGTQTDIAGLYAFEAEQKQSRVRHAALTPQDEDRQEVYNYVQATEYGLEQLKKKALTLNFIRELHEKLTDGVRGGDASPGAFRRVQNMIGGVTGAPDTARFMPPPITHLPEVLDAFEKYVNAQGELPPLIRLALIHYQFETIHPFRDGNGRIGRLLISLLLIYWKVLDHPLLHLSAYFERHRSEYCDRLLHVSQMSRWNEWLLFFLRGVKEQSIESAKRAKDLLDLQVHWRHKLQQERATRLVLAIGDQLFESPYTFTSDIQRRHKVSAPTALAALRKLEKTGLLRSLVPGGRSQLFFADPVIRLVQ
jgi:Fic family protein